MVIRLIYIYNIARNVRIGLDKVTANREFAKGNKLSFLKHTQKIN